jgi:DNA repair exonuclease SbcCD ATPase subunit
MRAELQGYLDTIGQGLDACATRMQQETSVANALDSIEENLSSLLPDREQFTSAVQSLREIPSAVSVRVASVLDSMYAQAPRQAGAVAEPSPATPTAVKTAAAQQCGEQIQELQSLQSEHRELQGYYQECNDEVRELKPLAKQAESCVREKEPLRQQVEELRQQYNLLESQKRQAEQELTARAEKLEQRLENTEAQRDEWQRYGTAVGAVNNKLRLWIGSLGFEDEARRRLQQFVEEEGIAQ